MSPLEILGAMMCLVALCFLISFGLVLGAWAAVQAGYWAFGAITIGVNHRQVVVERGAR